MSWIIDKVTCQDIKGFNGRYEFSFQQGLNLIHGPNGQGKSSIVDIEVGTDWRTAESRRYQTELSVTN